MPKVTEAHRESRREQVIAAALACFAEKGFQRTSIADISAAAHLSAGAIYLQFENKQQIALAAGREVLSRRLGDLVRSPELADPIAMMRTLLDGMVDEVLDTRLLLQLWGEATSDAAMAQLVEQIFAGLQNGWMAYLTGWATSRGAADPGAWAARALPAVLGLAQGFLVQRALFPHFDAEAYFAAADLIAGPALRHPGA